MKQFTITIKQFESLSKDGTIAFWNWMVKKNYWTKELFLLNEKDMAIKATYRKQPELLPTAEQIYDFLLFLNPRYWMCGDIEQLSYLGCLWNTVKARYGKCSICGNKSYNWCVFCWRPEDIKDEHRLFCEQHMKEHGVGTENCEIRKGIRWKDANKIDQTI